MAGIKLFECAICKQLFKNNVKGENRFIGNRKDVRLHLRKEHGIKGRKNTLAVKKSEFGQSDITAKTILYKEF